MPKISALPPMTEAHDDDEAPIVDDSVSTTKKFTLSLLKTWLQSLTSWVTSSMLAPGVVVNVDQVNSSALATGTGIIPFDDTLPQNTEGTEFLTLAFTPKSATNKLIVEGQLWLSINVVNANATVALFQDSIANAIAAISNFEDVSTGRQQMNVSHEMIAGTTSPITFKLRAGNDSAATTTLNGNNAARIFNTATKSWLKVTEVKQ